MGATIPSSLKPSSQALDWRPIWPCIADTRKRMEGPRAIVQCIRSSSSSREDDEAVDKIRPTLKTVKNSGDKEGRILSISKRNDFLALNEYIVVRDIESNSEGSK